MALQHISNSSSGNLVEKVPDEEHRLNLAFGNLDHFPPNLLNNFTHSIKLLDLSHNSFSDVSFLRQFPNLTCLILDHNLVNSATTFPTIPGLKVIWLNHNGIDRLFPFIQRLRVAYPGLECLSLMANEAVPMNVDDSTFYQHLQYRLFVVSWFPKLRHLDDQAVTDSERVEANRLYKRPLLERIAGTTAGNKVISGINSAFGMLRSKDHPHPPKARSLFI